MQKRKIDCRHSRAIWISMPENAIRMQLFFDDCTHARLPAICFSPKLASKWVIWSPKTLFNRETQLDSLNSRVEASRGALGEHLGARRKKREERSNTKEATREKEEATRKKQEERRKNQHERKTKTKSIYTNSRSTAFRRPHIII